MRMIATIALTTSFFGVAICDSLAQGMNNSIKANRNILQYTPKEKPRQQVDFGPKLSARPKPASKPGERVDFGSRLTKQRQATSRQRVVSQALPGNQRLAMPETRLRDKPRQVDFGPKLTRRKN